MRETVQVLRNRANDALLTKALTMNQAVSENAEELRQLEGMDEPLYQALKALGVVSVEDLADLAVFDLLDIEGMTEKRAAELILKAREPWFK